MVIELQGQCAGFGRRHGGDKHGAGCDVLAEQVQVDAIEHLTAGDEVAQVRKALSVCQSRDQLAIGRAGHGGGSDALIREQAGERARRSSPHVERENGSACRQRRQMLQCAHHAGDVQPGHAVARRNAEDVDVALDHAIHTAVRVHDALGLAGRAGSKKRQAFVSGVIGDPDFLNATVSRETGYIDHGVALTGSLVTCFQARPGRTAAGRRAYCQAVRGYAPGAAPGPCPRTCVPA